MLVYSGISRSGMSKRCQRQRERNEISEMTPRYLTGQDVGLQWYQPLWYVEEVPAPARAQRNL
jgi:hypothetical protein